MADLREISVSRSDEQWQQTSQLNTLQPIGDRSHLSNVRPIRTVDEDQSECEDIGVPKNIAGENSLTSVWPVE